MEPSGIDPAVTIERGPEATTLHFSGAMTALRLEHIETYLFESFEYDSYDEIICDFERLVDFDTSAAIMLHAFRKRCVELGHSCSFTGLHPTHKKLLRLSEHHTLQAQTHIPAKPGFLESLGMDTVQRFATFITLATFIGKIGMIALSYFHRFRNVRYKEIIFEIHESAIRALGVIGLITFLIGVVIAYQSSLQLKL
ncbi:MAG: STAS domain-containing protein, partial [Sulfurimonadaceae bacterium]|nr:STAS domain-containing protein [Sulfurimonadaceae bacterium]